MHCALRAWVPQSSRGCEGEPFACDVGHPSCMPRGVVGERSPPAGGPTAKVAHDRHTSQSSRGESGAQSFPVGGDERGGLRPDATHHVEWPYIKSAERCAAHTRK